MTLKVFSTSWEIPSGCGCCGGEYGDEIIIANSESEALGFGLNHVPATKAENWVITEIDITKIGIVR